MKKVIFFLLLPFITKGQTISTIAGDGIMGYFGDGGQATASKLHLPGKVLFDAIGNLYISDSWGHRVRKVDGSTGIITTIAGTGIPGYNGDNILATSAQLNDPVGLAFDTANNLFIADVLNHRIRKIDHLTGVITSVAGNGFGAGGLGAYYGDGGLATAAELNVPGSIAFDSLNNLFISDCRNYRIRKVNALTGVITTIAGTGISGYIGDNGFATSAELHGPQGICFDNFGHLYIADSFSSVRKIDITTGIISRVAGNGTYGYSGDGIAATSAQIQCPFDIAFDRIGNYYVAEFNGRIRKIDTFGIIHTMVGTTVFGYNGDEIPATAAELNETTGLAIDDCGSLYIADVSNERIRKVTYPPLLTTSTISISGIVSAPVGSSITLTASVASASSSYIIHWLNHGVEFTTTTVPPVTYTKPSGIDTITARIVPTGYGCYDSTISTAHYVTADATGVTGVAGTGWLSIYPNPVTNTLTITANNKIKKLSITNLLGQEVYTQEYQENKVELNIGYLPANVYFITVTDEEGNKTVRKIVKE